MPTTSICGTVRGNRRSDNIPEGAGGSAAGDATVRIAPAEPQISTQGLQFSGFSPIKPLPSIKEVVAQTQTLTQQSTVPATAEKPETIAEKSEETEAVVTEIEQVPQASGQETPELPSQEVQQGEPEAAAEPVSEPQPEGKTEDFAECWKQMVDSIFQKKPAFYHQLYDYLPGYASSFISSQILV